MWTAICLIIALGLLAGCMGRILMPGLLLLGGLAWGVAAKLAVKVKAKTAKGGK